MEAQPPSGSGSSCAAYPRWVMLEQYLQIKVEDPSSCSATDGDDAKTLAAAHTSAGHLIQVSIRFADPPALSRIFLLFPEGANKEKSKSKVLAAHGDSVLIQVLTEDNYEPYTVDHFIYNAGAATPSLWLLPPYYAKTHGYFTGSDVAVPQKLSEDATGFLRRGEELVVAQLWTDSFSNDTDTPRMAQLLLFRSNEWKWYEFDIIEAWDLPSASRWDSVIPVDDRLLCWVSMSNGVMLVDVFELSMQYLPLPMDPHDGGRLMNRNVCATAGGGTLKFVNIFGRCCCGAAASCKCEHSRHAYTIHTWTMRIGNGDTEWVKDGMIDCTELWSLDAYKGLPFDPLDRPIVSIHKPEVICFRLCGDKRNSRTVWQIMVNMRRKTIHSVSRHEEEVGYRYARDKLIPSNVSCFFNSTLTRQIPIDDEQRPPSAVVVDEHLIIRDDDDSSNPMFGALREIPSYGLGADEEVRAYRILISSDNGRRMKSLLRLPKDLRKDWLLMEIKASDSN